MNIIFGRVKSGNSPPPFFFVFKANVKTVWGLYMFGSMAGMPVNLNLCKNVSGNPKSEDEIVTTTGWWW